jgi:hypothetical protein
MVISTLTYFRAFTFLTEKDRIFWVVYMGLTVVIGICIATVFQKLDSKAFFNWKRKVIRFIGKLT